MKKLYMMILCCLFVSCMHALPPGLANCGNTCFLNASLQVLYAHDGLRAWFTNPKASSAYLSITSQRQEMQDKKVLGSELCQLFTEFGKQTNFGKRPYTFPCSGILQTFSNHVSDKLFGAKSCGRQEDATEFIIQLLDTISLTGLKSVSDLDAIYQLYMNSHIVCPRAGSSDKSETETMISAPVLDSETKQFIPTLSGCLRAYFSIEKNVEYLMKMELGTEYNCTKQLSLLFGPDCLLISLNRYKVDPVTKVSSKLYDRVYVPLQLNIAEFIQVPTGTTNVGDLPVSHKEDYHYQLQAVAVQGGTTRSGHYWAYVRQTATDTWYKCNDSVIEPISFHDPDMLAEIEGGSKAAGTGYLFVYQKVTVDKNALGKWQAVERSLEQHAQEGDFLFDRLSKRPLPPIKKSPITQTPLEKALQNLTKALQDLAQALT